MRPGISVRDGDFERQQIHLTQGGLVDPDVNGVPIRFGLVADQMFETCCHTLILQPTNVGGGQPTGEQRIFGECFKHPAAEGAAVQVDGRAEDHMGPVPDGLLSEVGPDLLQNIFAPVARQHCRVGQQAGRCAAAL